jgi:hypothetical protein
MVILAAVSVESAISQTWTALPTADAFVAASTPSTNYGAAGTLSIAPAGSAKGEFQTLMKFNLAPSVAAFDTLYGTGGWQITSITLRFASNTGMQGQTPSNSLFNNVNGGAFGIEYLSDDSWIEGTGEPMTPTTDGVTYNSLSSLLGSPHESVGGFTYTPPGNNVGLTYSLTLSSSFLADASSGGVVSFLLSAPSGGASYLFNSRSFNTAGNRPLITVTAAAVPEPSTIVFLVLGTGIALVTVRRRVHA